ncbi:zinc finger matrin-type protein CG9776-like isoform X2 [Cataglyphis hispanica]|uniref:zinc finger matrin-type protein CG9776-like isoform X2 n=1 Tax=Cataglyphis hispanica TaxID=1086592 RepID=UPI0021801979|nr:zinc finger matrin-type protein CG9776-like isoform X2 [Cataglyphis hispanica]
MESESRRKGPRSPSADSDDSSHARRRRKYDRSPSPRRSRYRRSRSRDRRSRSSSRDRRRKESSRSQDNWKQPPPSQSQSSVPNPNNSTGYVSAVHNQYQAPPPNTSQPPPPISAYNQGYNNYGYNYGTGYDYSYQQPAGYRSDYPPPNWQGSQVTYNNQQAPPPPSLTSQQESSRPIDSGSSGLVTSLTRPEDVKKEAIAAEVKQQKATLAKQREEYVLKSATLQRELEILRQQCDEIGKEGGRENNRIIKENQKLQVEIQNKMKSIHNVIDMLTGIIGDEVTVDDLKSKFKLELNKRSRSPKEDFPKGKSPSPDRSSVSDTDKESKAERDVRERRSSEDKPMYNFVHYDPEMHWCKVCDIFPKTAKEYLNHLHSNEHKEACLERKIVDMPWHERNGEGTEKEVPYYPGLPTKRTPIKGLQFFSASTAWYCKLCESWIGDLHCASLHLKSKRHSENFSRFVEQNPHWETDWMADREKAFSEEKHKQIQLELQKQKDDDPPTKSKKSKKNKKKSKKAKKRRNRSSASDTSSESENSDTESDQDTTKSIRVAMRNKMKASTQAILNEEIDYQRLKLKGHNWSKAPQINQSPLPEQHPSDADDRQLLNSIRDKLKAKQEEEMKTRKVNQEKTIEEEEEDLHQESYSKKSEDLEAWGPKEPPKPFWIKKEEEKQSQQPITNKPIELPKPEEMPKPHMGFWTKQQVNMTVKPPESKSMDKEDERDRDRDRYKDDRDRKYSSRYERRSRRDRDRDRDRERDRDRDYYDDRRKRDRDRDSNDSPRRDRNWRDNSPKRNYDKYSKDRRGDDNSSNDESKFEKKSNESKSKKGNVLSKKSAPQAAKGKLPFIGRLPLFKKKTEEPKLPEKDITPLPYQQSKFEDTPKVPNEIINPPGVVHITKLATPLNLNNNGSAAISLTNKTINQPMKILVAPPPPVLNESKPTPQVVDMEIDDQSEETVIEEQLIVEQQKQQQQTSSVSKLPLPPHPPPPLNRPPPSFTPNQQQQSVVHNRPPPTPVQSTPPQFTPNRPPPPFMSNPPPFVPPRFPPRQAVPPPAAFMTTQPPPIPSTTGFVQNHPQNPPPPPPPLPSTIDSNVTVAPSHSDVSDIPEPSEKRSADPSIPLPDDLQEALNIIFPKEETAESKQQHQQQQNQQESSLMYSSMYSMLGCVGYGPEYMDQPPPEIMQEAETEADTQPGPDDLRMLGIDEGDTIL